MWPTALSSLGVPLSGKLKQGAEPGRAIARLTDLGYGNALRDLFRAETPDGPVPVPLVKAMLEVLGDWEPRVDGLVVVESMTRPTLTADLADGLSRYLKVPVLGSYTIVDPDVRPGQGAVNSAQRVAALRRRFRLDADLADGARVLLVDDLTVSGWTLTMAAHDLREAGAAQVLPLVLATQS
jgi:ATP-dependent DNA helicase RecQ